MGQFSNWMLSILAGYVGSHLYYMPNKAHKRSVVDSRCTISMQSVAHHKD